MDLTRLVLHASFSGCEEDAFQSVQMLFPIVGAVADIVHVCFENLAYQSGVYLPDEPTERVGRVLETEQHDSVRICSE